MRRTLRTPDGIPPRGTHQPLDAAPDGGARRSRRVRAAPAILALLVASTLGEPVHGRQEHGRLPSTAPGGRTQPAEAAAVLATPAQAAADASFDAVFLDRTMRVDYFHTGGPRGEIIALDRVVSDGPWPGSRTRLVDTTGLGPYRFSVRDVSSGRELYSRGFSSIYAEWVTTAESRRVERTFHESLRFPWPRRPVLVDVERRVEGSTFETVWSTSVDPASRHVNPAPPPAEGRVWPILEHGTPAEKVDVLIIGDGYTEAEAAKLRADAERLVSALFALEPFTSRRSDFNVWGLHVPSPRSGVSRPRAAEFRRTPLSTEFNIFDLERYVLTYDNRRLRDVASAVPYEFVEILVNERQYGGGGIFNLHATTSVDGAYADYVFVHEFAHHFAALADEYYTSDVAYETGGDTHPEPWERNVTALHDPAQLKWRSLVSAGTPLPTPWDKEAYEAANARAQAERAELRAAGAPEARLDELFRREQEASAAFLASQRYAGQVGAFEGASYESRGLYRPEVDCIMFSRNPVGFCRVCRAAIEEVIDLYTRP